MDKFNLFLQQFDITQNVTDDEVEKAQELLRIYVPVLRRSSQRISEMEDECYESRCQSISDFINLAIDYERDTDRKHIAERLAKMGHSMQLLSLLEQALILVKSEPHNGELYYKILSMRYFDAYCRSNEDAFLTLGISSSSYYRNIKKAVRLFAANLWCIVIPDLIIEEQTHKKKMGELVGVR